MERFWQFTKGIWFLAWFGTGAITVSAIFTALTISLGRWSSLDLFGIDIFPGIDADRILSFSGLTAVAFYLLTVTAVVTTMVMAVWKAAERICQKTGCLTTIVDIVLRRPMKRPNNTTRNLIPYLVTFMEGTTISMIAAWLIADLLDIPVDARNTSIFITACAWASTSFGACLITLLKGVSHENEE